MKRLGMGVGGKKCSMSEMIWSLYSLQKIQLVFLCRSWSVLILLVSTKMMMSSSISSCIRRSAGQKSSAPNILVAVLVHQT